MANVVVRGKVLPSSPLPPREEWLAQCPQQGLTTSGVFPPQGEGVWVMLCLVQGKRGFSCLACPFSTPQPFHSLGMSQQCHTDPLPLLQQLLSLSHSPPIKCYSPPFHLASQTMLTQTHPHRGAMQSFALNTCQSAFQ